MRERVRVREREREGEIMCIILNKYVAMCIKKELLSFS